MKPIMFRAWNKEKKVMIDLYKITPLALHPEIKGDGLYIPFDDRLELMQFTGLLDRNGKKIFEGDILHYWVDSQKEYLWTVGFEDGSFVRQREFRGGSSALLNHEVGEFTIIGDIYETPELLEEKK